jgi:hypothetical protein
VLIASALAAVAGGAAIHHVDLANLLATHLFLPTRTGQLICGVLVACAVRQGWYGAGLRPRMWGHHDCGPAGVRSPEVAGHPIHPGTDHRLWPDLAPERKSGVAAAVLRQRTSGPVLSTETRTCVVLQPRVPHRFAAAQRQFGA